MGPGPMGGGPMGGPMGRPPMPPGGRPRHHEQDRRPPFPGGKFPEGGPGGFPGKPPHIPPEPEKEFDLKEMEAQCEDMMKITFLTKDNASFTKTTGGDLCLSFNGQTYSNIQLIETFPFTEPYAFISVRNLENKSKEIGLIEQLDSDFDPKTISVIKEHLDIFYHMPVIEKILQTKSSGGFTTFTVMTNCGETQFSLQSNGSHITALTENRLIIQDVSDNRFEIPDKRKLSGKELKKIDIFL